MAVDREQLRRAARLHPTAWAMYASDGLWQNARHFDFLAERVLAMRRGEIQRLCVSMPPGSGKSEYLSLYVASWWLATRPNDRVVIASYGKSLAVGWSERARDLLADMGVEVFGVTANARQAAHWWYPRLPDGSPCRGYFYAVGRGGALTGKRAELLIIDDLLKDDEEARSDAIRNAAWRWFDKVAMTRLLPHSCVFKIGTRWHTDDTIGRLEKRQAAGEVDKRWEFVNLPAIAGDDDPLGRQPGEALWPRMWPIDALEGLRRERDPYTWSSLYQGSPTPEGGGLFKADWLRSYTEAAGILSCGELRVPRARLRLYSTVDLAGSKKDRADYTVISTFGLDHETRTLWLLDVVRQRLEAPQIIGAMREVQQRMRPVTFYAERTAPQLNLVHRLRFAEQAGEKLDPSDTTADVLIGKAVEAGLPVVKLDPGSTDKVTRSAPAQAVMAAGRLMTPERADWLEAWKSELLAFPESGTKDDQVDTLSYGVQVFLEVLQASAWVTQATRDPNALPIGGRLM